MLFAVLSASPATSTKQIKTKNQQHFDVFGLYSVTFPFN